jgi:Spy/CpxP family protein refolding chaperone
MAINRLLVLAAVPFVMGGFSFAVSDKAVADQSALVAQNAPQPTGQRKGWGKKFDQLGLSAEQQTRIQQIKQSTRQQMDAIFTAEQKQQKQAARQQRQRPNLNLTEDQKARLQALRQSSKTQIEAVLTDAQKQKLQELKQQWQQNRQNRQKPTT